MQFVRWHSVASWSVSCYILNHVNYILYHFMNVSTSSTYIQLQNANECKWDFMLDASTIQPVQLQNANEILCWMLQLTQHIQLQNENDDLKGINYKWFQIQNGWHNPSCLYKKILAGNLYCSPSPPHFVAEIWRWVVFPFYKKKQLPCSLRSAPAVTGPCLEACTRDRMGM